MEHEKWEMEDTYVGDHSLYLSAVAAVHTCYVSLPARYRLG